MKRIVRRDHLSVAEAARDAAMLENGRLKGLEEAVNAVWESAPSDPESLAELEAFRTAADALRAALDAPDAEVERNPIDWGVEAVTAFAKDLIHMAKHDQSLGFEFRRDVAVFVEQALSQFRSMVQKRSREGE